MVALLQYHKRGFWDYFKKWCDDFSIVDSLTHFGSWKLIMRLQIQPHQPHTRRTFHFPSNRFFTNKLGILNSVIKKSDHCTLQHTYRHEIRIVVIQICLTMRVLFCGTCTKTLRNVQCQALPNIRSSAEYIKTSRGESKLLQKLRHHTNKRIK